MLRLRWSVRETQSELETAYAELGRYLADTLNAEQVRLAKLIVEALCPPNA